MQMNSFSTPFVTQSEFSQTFILIIVLAKGLGILLYQQYEHKLHKIAFGSQTLIQVGIVLPRAFQEIRIPCFEADSY